MAERSHPQVVQPAGATERDGELELERRALGLAGPQCGAAEVGAHERAPRLSARVVLGFGIGQQRVGLGQTVADVAAQASEAEPRDRARLGERPQAAGGERSGRAPGRLEVRRRGGAVAGVEQAARDDRRELGVVGDELRWQLRDQRAERTAAPADQQLDAVGDRQSRGELPVLARHAVLQRGPDLAFGGVPARRPRVQLAHPVAELAPRAHLQQAREQRVVAIPLPTRIDADDEAVGPLELRERLGARGLARDRVGQSAAHAVGDRGAQQEPAPARRLAVQDLRHQIVGDDPVVAPELGDEAFGIVMALQAECGEPQARGPALRAPAEHGDQRGIEDEPVRRQQLGGLRLGEREVARPDLRERAEHAGEVQRERWVRSPAQDHPQRRRRVQHEKRQLIEAFARAQHVDVVEHEHRGLGHRGELVDQPRHEARARATHGRTERRGPGDAAGPAQRGEHRVPQLGRIVVTRIQRHPRHASRNGSARPTMSTAATSSRCREGRRSA